MSHLIFVSNRGFEYIDILNAAALLASVRPGQSAEVVLPDGAIMSVEQTGTSPSDFMIGIRNGGLKYLQLQIGAETMANIRPGDSGEILVPAGDTLKVAQEDVVIPIPPTPPDPIDQATNWNNTSLAGHVTFDAPNEYAADIEIGDSVTFSDVYDVGPDGVAVKALLEGTTVEVTAKVEYAIIAALDATGLDMQTTSTGLAVTKKPPPVPVTEGTLATLVHASGGNMVGVVQPQAFLDQLSVGMSITLSNTAGGTPDIDALVNGATVVLINKTATQVAFLLDGSDDIPEPDWTGVTCDAANAGGVAAVSAPAKKSTKKK